MFMLRLSAHLATLFLGQACLSGLPVLHAHTFPCNCKQQFLNQQEETDYRNYFIINLHESMGPGQDQTCDPWVREKIYISLEIITCDPSVYTMDHPD